MTKPQTTTRYALLDEIRGLDLVSMMLYHGLWDVVFLFGMPLAWYAGYSFCCRGSACRWGTTLTGGER